jgi:ABC-type branched-subunit amino acid transport system ATPase component/predicted MFS family arabinose efflux permease
MTTSSNGSGTLVESDPADVIAELERTAAGFRHQVRSAVDMAGDVAPVRLRHAIAEGGGMSLLVVVSLLAGVIEAAGYALVTLGPDMARSFGTDESAITGASTAALGLVAALAVPVVVLTRRRVRRVRALAAGGAAAVAGTLLAATASAQSFATVGLLLGLGAVVTRVLHPAVLADAYSPAARGRILTLHHALSVLGAIVAAGVVALVTGPLGLTWRAGFLVLGGLGMLVVAPAWRLAEPGRGRWERDAAHGVVFPDDRSAGGPGTRQLSIGEAFRRVLLVPAVRPLLFAGSALGAIVLALLARIRVFLEADWHYTSGEQAIVVTCIGVVAFAGLVGVGIRADALMRRDPSRLTLLTAVLVVDAAAALALGAHAMYNGMAIPLVVLGGAGVLCAVPVVTLLLLSVVPPDLRTAAAALQAICVAGIGGIASSVVFTSVDQRSGVVALLTTMLLPAAVAGAALVKVGHAVRGDLDQVVDDLVQHETVELARHRGGEVPLLACRNVDFFYGQMQILFGVDFSVRDGEMVALLGTNGAGKSTLLRAISGLGIPRRGTVRFVGEDITHSDVARRVGLGISHVEGGKAVFGPLTVVENLRLYSFSHGRDAARTKSGMDTAFEVFPRLGERRNQRASTLSGGEQQMLALAKALLLEPRVLLIDELSLGLAPVVVTELLDIVRTINQRGTAVVLVEQSVSTALALVDHAYFMEKGQIRFSGAASDLVQRDDLLRSVFLQGATRAHEGVMA